MKHYPSMAAFLTTPDASPDVVFLDRYLPGEGLSDDRIRDIRHRHKNCGVIMYTGSYAPHLEQATAHGGAVAVVEKGTLGPKSIYDLVEMAAVLGPTIELR